MEKVILSKEQSKALEKMRSCHHLRNDKEALLVKHATGWMNAYQELNEIPMLGFAQLVLNDFAYEIEPEKPKFQVGDKLYSPIKGILNVISLSGSIMSVKEFSYPLPADEYRHATPEEIYWLETLKREKVGEFHLGDIFIRENGEGFAVDTNGLLDYANKSYKKGNFQGLHPAESFRRFPKEQSNAHHR